MLAVFFLAACQPSGPDGNPPDPAVLRTEWTGTELLGGLAEQVGGTQRKSRSWPNAPPALAGRLRRDLPAQGWHRGNIPAPKAHHPPDGRARKAGGATVRTVRTVRAHAEIQSGQRLRGSGRADGSPRCGR